jgi:hypothetical protein
LLTFDEQRLSDRLTRMSADRQLAFAASCCERVAPIYLQFAALEGAGTGPLIQDILEGIWSASLDSAGTDARGGLADLDLGSLAARMEGPYPSGWGGYGRDALTVFYFAIEFKKTGLPAHASECGRWVFNIVDAVAMDSEPGGVLTLEVQTRIAANRAIQRELRKQETDIATLDQAAELDSHLLARLRGESRRLGMRLLREVEFTVRTRRPPI